MRIGVFANADSAKAAVNVMTNAVNGLAKSVAQANSDGAGKAVSSSVKRASACLARLERNTLACRRNNNADRRPEQDDYLVSARDSIIPSSICWQAYRVVA